MNTLELLNDEKWLDEQIEKNNLELGILEKHLFTEQKLFIQDKAKRKTAICSRRAGKTFGVGYELLESMYERTEGDCAYIGLTRGHAKKLMFNHLVKLKNKYGFKLTENRADLTFTCDKTGNTLYITGANNEEDTEKIRGLKLKKIVLDEVASFKTHINYLIEEVLEPTTIDLNGSIILIGTPSSNPLEDNLFYRATSGLESGWSRHHWTIKNNPYIPHAESWLKEYKERKGWDDNHPIYLREWCGVWTTDKSSLVYKYNKSKQDYEELPKQKLTYVMGVDLGFDDAFAIVVLAFSYDIEGVCFVVDEYKKEGLIPEKMAEQIMHYKNIYKPIKIVADTGGLGKAIVEEFKHRYGMNVDRAEKKDKLAFIEMVNGDLLSGKIKIKNDSLLAAEMKLHQWDADDHQKEDSRTDNHLLDALLYGMRQVKHFLGKEKIPQARPGTTEYYNKQEELMLKQQLEQFKQQQENEELL